MTGTNNNQHWSHTGATLSRLFISLSRAESRAVILTRSTHRPTSSHIATLPVPVRLQSRIHSWNSTPLQLQSTRVPQRHSAQRHSTQRHSTQRYKATPSRHIATRPAQRVPKPHQATPRHFITPQGGSHVHCAVYARAWIHHSSSHHRSPPPQHVTARACAHSRFHSEADLRAHQITGGASSPHGRARSDSGRAPEERGWRSRRRREEG